MVRNPLRIENQEVFTLHAESYNNSNSYEAHLLNVLTKANEGRGEFSSFWSEWKILISKQTKIPILAG